MPFVLAVIVAWSFPMARTRTGHYIYAIHTIYAIYASAEASRRHPRGMDPHHRLHPVQPLDVARASAGRGEVVTLAPPTHR